MGTYNYLTLLSEGGIVQWEYLYSDEMLAWHHRTLWLEITDDNPDGNEDRDCYIYRILTDTPIVAVERGNGSNEHDARYYPVD